MLGIYELAEEAAVENIVDSEDLDNCNRADFCGIMNGVFYEFLTEIYNCHLELEEEWFKQIMAKLRNDKSYLAT